jgi:AcrR family transcriptional regulator
VKQEKQDRRSRRTRHLVHSAFRELLLEKRYEAITVRDILHRAGIGSSTFYAHYYDKEDVQTELIEQLLEQLLPSIAWQSAEGRILPSLAIFRHVQHHSQHALFQALVLGHAEEQVWEMLQTRLSSTIEQTLASTRLLNHPHQIPLAVVAQYLSGAFLNLLTWWIKAEIPYSAEQIDEIFWQLALPGIQTIMKEKSE